MQGLTIVTDYELQTDYGNELENDGQWRVMDVARTDGLYTIVSQNTTDMGTKGNWEDIKIDS